MNISYFAIRVKDGKKNENEGKITVSNNNYNFVSNLHYQNKVLIL